MTFVFVWLFQKKLKNDYNERETTKYQNDIFIVHQPIYVRIEATKLFRKCLGKISFEPLTDRLPFILFALLFSLSIRLEKLIFNHCPIDGIQFRSVSKRDFGSVCEQYLSSRLFNDIDIA
jgi:hypothetical protein